MYRDVYAFTPLGPSVSLVLPDVHPLFSLAFCRFSTLDSLSVMLSVISRRLRCVDLTSKRETVGDSRKLVSCKRTGAETPQPEFFRLFEHFVRGHQAICFFFLWFLARASYTTSMSMTTATSDSLRKLLIPQDEATSDNLRKLLTPQDEATSNNLCKLLNPQDEATSDSLRKLLNPQDEHPSSANLDTRVSHCCTHSMLEGHS